MEIYKFLQKLCFLFPALICVLESNSGEFLIDFREFFWERVIILKIFLGLHSSRGIVCKFRHKIFKLRIKGEMNVKSEDSFVDVYIFQNLSLEVTSLMNISTLDAARVEPFVNQKRMFVLSTLDSVSLNFLLSFFHNFFGKSKARKKKVSLLKMCNFLF